MNLEKIGVQLSYFLRHCRQPQYVAEDGGWAEVDVIVDALRQKYHQVDFAVLEEVVARDSKGRFSFDDTRTRIRANQGHSIPGVMVEMSRPEPPEYLYHGTSDRFLSAILEQGLRPMSRQYVHLSRDLETALTVGKRHGGKMVVLQVRARDFAGDGHTLMLSANGVWQAEPIAPAYLALLEHPQP